MSVVEPAHTVTAAAPAAPAIASAATAAQACTQTSAGQARMHSHPTYLEQQVVGGVDGEAAVVAPEGPMGAEAAC